MTALKKCPFCGGKATVMFCGEIPYVLEKYHNKYVFAGCPKCKITTSLYNANNNTRSPLLNEQNTLEAKEKAIADWNRRAK